MKTVQLPQNHPSGLKQVRFGRSRPKPGFPRFRLSRYMVRTALPAPPASVDYSPDAAASLSNVYLNQELGCCVIAGGFHVIGVETGNATGGTPWVATNDQVIAQYSAIGGYVPGNPATDQGCDEVTAMNYWTSTGFPDGSKLLGWLEVDATNQLEMQTALDLFEDLLFGIELPDAYVDPFPSGNGFTWDVAGDPVAANGHCIIGCGYDSTGIKVDTWGMLGTMTWAAVAKYCVPSAGGALYVLLSQDEIGKGASVCPNGIDWSTLLNDFNAMGGNVQVPASPPAPSPAPSPAPNPDGSVSLAQATAWATSGFAGRYIFTQDQAVATATSGLSANWPTASKPKS